MWSERAVENTVCSLVGQAVGEVCWVRISGDPLIWEEKVVQSRCLASIRFRGGPLGPGPLWPLEGQRAAQQCPLFLGNQRS